MTIDYLTVQSSRQLEPRMSLPFRTVSISFQKEVVWRSDGARTSRPQKPSTQRAFCGQDARAPTKAQQFGTFRTVSRVPRAELKLMSPPEAGVTDAVAGF